jgi:hypothetical protein
MTVVSQLRIYTIREGKMDEWIKGWREGVYPLRLKQGFRIDGAWVLEGQNKFVWILTYDGPEEWQSKDAAYYASPERAALNPDPAQHIVHNETHFITSVLSEGV